MTSPSCHVMGELAGVEVQLAAIASSTRPINSRLLDLHRDREAPVSWLRPIPLAPPSASAARPLHPLILRLLTRGGSLTQGRKTSLKP